MVRKNFIEKETAEVKGILGRLKRKDFSGNTGQAIKNSTYQLATNLVAKFGSIIFIIFLARLINPDIFGLYGLTLSTILFFNAFSDLGISTALLAFVSKKMGERNYQKAKDYYQYLFKYKLILLIISSTALLVLSYFVSNYYYNKPIFLALAIGSLYLFFSGISSFLNQFFMARNNFRIGFFKEILIQLGRLIFVPLIIILLISKVSTQILLLSIFSILTLTYILSIFQLYFRLPKKDFKDLKPRKLNIQEKSKIKRFVIPMSVGALSGTFFGSIDMLMLGRFVSAEFIGYYQAAFGLITAAAALLAFSGIALFPIFSRLDGKRLERGLVKSIRLTILLSLPATIFTFFISSKIVNLIYGPKYLPASNVLQIFSLLLISLPLAGIYNTYYQSRGHTSRFASILIASTILNIILNYILITTLLPRGMMMAVMGAGIATIISGYSYLTMLIIFRKKS